MQFCFENSLTGYARFKSSGELLTCNHEFLSMIDFHPNPSNIGLKEILLKWGFQQAMTDILEPGQSLPSEHTNSTVNSMTKSSAKSTVLKNEEYVVEIIQQESSYDVFVIQPQNLLPESRLELQMKDIEVNALEYQLKVLQNLLRLISKVDEETDISYKFQEFLCSQFLFSAAWFYQRSPEPDYHLTLRSIYPLNCPIRPIKSKELEKILRSPSGLLTSDLAEQLRSLIGPGSTISFKEAIALPLFFDNNSHGYFLFFTSPQHHGFKRSDLALLQNITELITPLYRNAYLLELSMRDELSGLGNRRMFNRVLQRETSISTEAGGPLSLIMIDIDHFKKINDTYGHSVGDRAISHLGQIIKSSLRPYDLSFRYGGEEFSILLRANAYQASMVAQRIAKALESSTIATEKMTSLNFTVSMGIAEYKMHQDKNSFVHAADTALYMAKEQGRNRIIVSPA